MWSMLGMAPSSSVATGVKLTTHSVGQRFPVARSRRCMELDTQGAPVSEAMGTAMLAVGSASRTSKHGGDKRDHRHGLEGGTRQMRVFPLGSERVPIRRLLGPVRGCLVGGERPDPEDKLSGDEAHQPDTGGHENARLRA